MGIVKNIFTGYKNLLTGKEGVMAKRRTSICNTCTFREKKDTKHWCTQCPCFMPAKVKAPDAKCPKKKW